MNTQEKIIKKIKPYIGISGEGPFNYERFLCFDKAPYLDAFVKGIPFSPFELEIQMSSRCNLYCKWCIGNQIQTDKHVLNLPNTLNKDNIDRVIDGVLDMKINGLAIDTVKFSGFIGEPLIQKEATMIAMKKLSNAGIRVGLFTNGVFLTEDTWETVANIDYVHLSLDAGPKSFYWIKENQAKTPYSQNTYNSIIDNIAGLNAYRKKTNGKVKINIGYVIIVGNHEEIYKTTSIVKNAGADMIRFKCDITNRYTSDTEWLDEVFKEIKQAKKDFHSPDFSVISIHSKKDVESNSHVNWTCEKGCLYQYFVATIGSDGNMYFCDHNTMPGAIPIGNAINNSFGDIWNSPRHKYLAEGIKYTCQSNVCPPFGNRVNAFLNELVELREEYGADKVVEALNVIRKEN